MTKQELETHLSGVPENVNSAHPDEIKSYFSVTDPELTENELNLLTANVMFNNLPQQQREMYTWNKIRVNVLSKYAQGPTNLIQEIIPFVRIVHAQYESGLTVTAIE